MVLKSGFLAVVILTVLAFQAEAAGLQVLFSGLKSPVGLIHDREGNLPAAELVASRLGKFDRNGKRGPVTKAVPNLEIELKSGGYHV